MAKTASAALILADEPIVVPARNRGRVSMLDETEARKLTTQIKHVGVRLWLLVAEAHDRQAWAALGYASWKDYATQELQMSESRSYQVLEQARVMRAISDAGADPNEIEPPTARDTRVIKDDLAAVKRATKSAIRRGEPVDIALDELIRRKRKTSRTTITRSETEVMPENVFDITSLPPSAEDPEPPKIPQGHARCPACKGEGVVERFMVKPLRQLVRQLG